MTSKELANITMEENQPYDYEWIKHIYCKYGHKGLRYIAKGNVECFAPNGASKQLIGRATTMVTNRLYGLVR